VKWEGRQLWPMKTLLELPLVPIIDSSLLFVKIFPVSCSWHQFTNSRIFLLKYSFTFLLFLDWNHPTFSKSRGGLKMHFTASLQRSYHQILLNNIVNWWK
jgi:hypothetical protein